MTVRVAQLGPDPSGPGGMPAALGTLLSSPLARRYSFDVIPTYSGSRPLPRLALFIRALGSLVRWCAGSGPRLVHVHMAARGSMYRKAAVIAAAKTMRRPVILQIHAGPGDIAAFLQRLGPVRRVVLGTALSAADRVLCVSKSSAEALRGVIGKDILVVPNPPPPISSRGPRPPRDDVTALFLGGFANPAKGGSVVLAALPAALERCPELRVVLAGPGPEPQISLDRRVDWRGWLETPARDEAFWEADIFMIPSLSEGMPIALLEAMAQRLPVVASAVGGMAEILADGCDAVLVTPGDPAELAQALAGLAADADRRRALAEGAVERIRRLAATDVYGTLDRLYEDLLAR